MWWPLRLSWRGSLLDGAHVASLEDLTCFGLAVTASCSMAAAHVASTASAQGQQTQGNTSSGGYGVAPHAVGLALAHVLWRAVHWVRCPPSHLFPFAHGHRAKPSNASPRR